MRFGYTAKVKGAPSVEEQRALLADIGVTRIYDEGAPPMRVKPGESWRPIRDALVEIIRSAAQGGPDQICIATAGLAARNAGDLFTFLAAVSTKGGSVYVIDMESDFTADEDQAALARAFTGDKGKAQTEAARSKPGKKKGGRPPALKLSCEDTAIFRRMWGDPATDIAAMCRRFGGVHRSTIGRRAAKMKLGPKA